MIKNITLENLKKSHGDGAENIFKQVAEIGGFGDVQIGYQGGLDISGLPEKTQEQIAKLLIVPEKSDAAAELVKNNDRKALDKMAKDLGLDGNKYTDKAELATAIIQAQKEQN